MANLGSWEFIPKTGATTISKQLLRMYGFGPDEAWDEARYWDRLEPADRPRIREIYEKSVSESKAFSFRTLYHMPDGTTRMYCTRGIPVPGADGTTERIYGIVQDVTEQGQQEANLHRLSQRLLRLRDTERRQTAIELHETVGQSLSSLKMCLGRLREALPEVDDRGRALVRDSMSLAEDAVREVRVVSYLMHPAMLDEGGLSPALDWLARGFSERSGIEVKVEIPEDFERCAQDIETAVFRIVQESLTNIHRYSGSRTADIRVDMSAGIIRVEIQDAGCGLPQPVKPGSPVGLSGVGIVGMRERVRQLNGEFTIESAPGRGTLVRAVLPVSAAARSSAAECLMER
jgi:signal transduction histidine kinase